MRESISFAKLKDGSWGVRVATNGRHPEPGKDIMVTRRDGSVSRVTLGSICDVDAGAFPAKAVYYRITKSSKGAPPKIGNAVEQKARFEHVRDAEVVSILPAALMTWHEDSQEWICEASTLGFTGRVDGFELEGRRYVYHRSERTVDGELIADLYADVEMGKAGPRVVILND